MTGTLETGTILDKIVADKRKELERNRKRVSKEVMRSRAEGWAKGWGKYDQRWHLSDAISQGPRIVTAGVQRIRLIAEIKVASPSKGRLIPVLTGTWLDDFADAYTSGAACGISVVTEKDRFLGDRSYMRLVRNYLRRQYQLSRPSVLRKDFLFDPYHIWEAKAYGADTLLLIVAILEEQLLKDLLAQTKRLGMDALVEVHNEAEIQKALRAGAEIVGINNRDLKTFDEDIGTTERLRPLIPEGKLVVAESAIRTRADVERVAAAGVNAILVGEALVTAPDVYAKMRELLI